MFEELVRMSQGVRGQRVGAMVLAGKTRIIGRNSRKTHPRLLMHSKHAAGVSFSNHHAEMDAILRTKRLLGSEYAKRVHKLRIFVMRVCPNDNIGLAKPCSACYDRLIQMGFLPKNIYYTDKDGIWRSCEGA